MTLDRPVLVDTAVWTWVRDRRFPHLAAWFNAQVAQGRVLTCAAIELELARLAANGARARALSDRLAAFEAVPMPAAGWDRARELQLALADAGTHRRVPPVDVLIAAAAEAADVEVLHYDRDYERIGSVSGIAHRWFVPDGSLAP